MTDYLTIGELAAYLRTTERAVRRWRERGYGPPAARVGARLLFERTDIDRWVEGRKDFPDAVHALAASSRLRRRSIQRSRVAASSR